MFKVSVCLWRSASPLLAFQDTMCPLTHVSRTNLIFFTFKDGGLDIWRCTHSYTKLTFHTSIHIAKHSCSLLGDICFAKIKTMLWMHVVPLTILEKWVKDGKFNPEWMAESDYSHSMALLVTLSPNTQGTGLESVGIGLIIHQHKAPIG